MAPKRSGLSSMALERVADALRLAADSAVVLARADKHHRLRGVRCAGDEHDYDRDDRRTTAAGLDARRDRRLARLDLAEVAVCPSMRQRSLIVLHVSGHRCTPARARRAKEMALLRLMPDKLSASRCPASPGWLLRARPRRRRHVRGQLERARARSRCRPRCATARGRRRRRARWSAGGPVPARGRPASSMRRATPSMRMAAARGRVLARARARSPRLHVERDAPQRLAVEDVEPSSLVCRSGSARSANKPLKRIARDARQERRPLRCFSDDQKSTSAVRGSTWVDVDAPLAHAALRLGDADGQQVPVSSTSL